MPLTELQGATTSEITTSLAEDEGIVVSVHNLEAPGIVLNVVKDLISALTLNLSEVGGHIDHGATTKGIISHQTMVRVASFIAVGVTLLERDNINFVELLSESQEGNSLPKLDGDRLTCHNDIRFNCLMWVNTVSTPNYRYCVVFDLKKRR